MGLLQKAVETYDAHSNLVGKEREGHQVLAPVGHIIAQADLEITLEPDGSFSSARWWTRAKPKFSSPPPRPLLDAPAQSPKITPLRLHQLHRSLQR